MKVSPVRRTLRSNQKVKLSRRYIRPFEILSRVRDVTYKLELPPELSRVHIFHVSMLKKYISDSSHVLHYEPLRIKEDDATYVEKPVQIIDTKEKVLRKQTIHWVKVLWDNHGPEEAKWELRDQVQRQYPHLLPEVSHLHLDAQMS